MRLYIPVTESKQTNLPKYINNKTHQKTFKGNNACEVNWSYAGVNLCCYSYHCVMKMRTTMHTLESKCVPKYSITRPKASLAKGNNSNTHTTRDLHTFGLKVCHPIALPCSGGNSE